MTRVSHTHEQVMGQPIGEDEEKVLLAHGTAPEKLGSEKHGSLRELLVFRMTSH